MRNLLLIYSTNPLHNRVKFDQIVAVQPNYNEERGTYLPHFLPTNLTDQPLFKFWATNSTVLEPFLVIDMEKLFPCFKSFVSIQVMGKKIYSNAAIE